MEPYPYWRTVLQTARTQTFSHAQNKIVLGLVLTMISLVLQYALQIRSPSDTAKIAISLIVSAVIVMAGSFVKHLILTPPSMHQERENIIAAKDQGLTDAERTRSKLIADHNAEIRDIERSNASLFAQIEELKKPKRTAAEDHHYRTLMATLEKYGEDEKTILRNLRIHGKMIEHPMLGVYPLPSSRFSRERARSILGQFENDHLVTPEHHQISSGFEYTWQIAPGIATILDELLYQDNSSFTPHT